LDGPPNLCIAVIGISDWILSGISYCTIYLHTFLGVFLKKYISMCHFLKSVDPENIILANENSILEFFHY